MNQRLADKEEQIAKQWQQFKGFMVRPSQSLVSYYGEIIASGTLKTKSLLYGGTPEIRSIFQKLKFPLTMVDRSIEQLYAMGLLTESGQPMTKGETLANQSWLALDKMDQHFDLLIGDKAINGVNWTEFDLFLEQAWRRLRPDGLFVCHLQVMPADRLTKQTVEELVYEYKHKKIRSIYDLASRLNFICFDHDTYRMSWQQTIKKLGRMQLDRFKPDLDFFGTFAPCHRYFYCPPLTHFEKLASNYFRVKDIFYPHEYDYCLYGPVFVFEKR